MEEEAKLAGGGEVGEEGRVRLVSNFTVGVLCLILQLSNKASARLLLSKARGRKSSCSPQNGSQSPCGQLASHTSQVKGAVGEGVLLQAQHHLRLPFLARHLEQPDPSQQPEHILRADSEPGKAGDHGGSHLSLFSPRSFKTKTLPENWGQEVLWLCEEGGGRAEAGRETLDSYFTRGHHQGTSLNDNFENRN